MKWVPEASYRLAEASAMKVNSFKVRNSVISSAEQRMRHLWSDGVRVMTWS